MSGTAAQNAIAVVGVDIGKNSFHVVGLDDRGAIVLRQKWSRSQVEARFANMPPCLIGMEALRRSASSQSETQSFRPRCQANAGEVRTAIFQGQKNDFRVDAARALTAWGSGDSSHSQTRTTRCGKRVHKALGNRASRSSICLTRDSHRSKA